MSDTRTLQEMTDAGLRKVLSLTEILCDSKSCALIYQQIEQLLQEQKKFQQEAQRNYAQLTQMLLDTLARALPLDAELRLLLRVLQLRMQPPLSPGDFTAIEECLREFGGLASRKDVPETPTEQASSPENNNSPNPPAEAPPADSERNPNHREAKVAPSQPLPPSNPAQPISVEKIEEAAIQGDDASHHQHTDSKRKEMDELQTDLLESVSSIKEGHERFDGQIRDSLRAMRKADDPEKLHHLKEILIRQSEHMLRENSLSVNSLGLAHNILQQLQANSKRLNDELTRVHLLSLTDDLTELPNRRAFLRHLADELSRSDRYGFPLSVAVIDLDYFKNINDQHGHSVGDTVLCQYAKDIFSILRHHDIVARYGGEEFAIMLPNTQIDKALFALNKVLHRARRSHFPLKEGCQEVPTFSAGLVQHKHGESLDSLLDRADIAMYKAKENGRNQIVTDPEIDPGTADLKSRRNNGAESAAPENHDQGERNKSPLRNLNIGIRE